ncbi:hypothetical protein C8N25_113120 [Algoriphagus antarcticus]|uniref:Uncharacterized protein n=1 Tax=Algoriphagus antarcticus TaxID=238540 RepID=A0A3E0DQT6_9BACT|nr:hypothetical protein C8N25_113120 [Algoriphagus antarcticus]
MREAADGNALAEFFPAVAFNEMLDYICEFDAVEGIVSLSFQNGI